MFEFTSRCNSIYVLSTLGRYFKSYCAKYWQGIGSDHQQPGSTGNTTQQTEKTTDTVTPLLQWHTENQNMPIKKLQFKGGHKNPQALVVPEVEKAVQARYKAEPSV